MDNAAQTPNLRWRRVLLKLSGESFAGEQHVGLNYDVISRIAGEVVEAAKLGAEIAIVIGGGNIIRGGSTAKQGMDRSQGDYMGMLATVINAMALQDAIEHLGQPTRVQTAITMTQVAEPFIRRRAIRHLEKGRVVILAGGTGNPYFTTDTASSLRALELKCDAFLKATNVDGIYDSDPKLNPDAKRYNSISYEEAVAKKLKVMDLTAMTMCMENNMPILVFDIARPGAIKAVLQGEAIGTQVGG